MSDELEVLKSGIEGATAGALKPIHELVSKLAGPAAAEIGQTLQEHVRVWRFSRALRLAAKVENLLGKQDAPTRSVQLRVLLPSLEYASLEDDDFLQDHWATLLANASNARHPDGMLTVFVEILKQLSAIDARLLNEFYKDYYGPSQDGPGNEIGNLAELQPIFETVYVATGRALPIPDTGHNGEVEAELTLSLENLIRLGLVVRRQVRRTDRENWYFSSPREDNEESKVVIQSVYYFSSLGRSFVLSCRPKKV